jgi:dTDP-4-dehydrorhamnose 3,5-epimerase-like enzyme
VEAEPRQQGYLLMHPRDIHAGAIVELPVVRDARGTLVFVEATRDVPFAVKRVYYFCDMPPGQSRGRHAHRNCETFLMAAKGRIRVDLDDGTQRETHVLATPDHGILVPRMVWLEVTLLLPDALCLVLASEYYEIEDQVSNYGQFLLEVASQT